LDRIAKKQPSEIEVDNTVTELETKIPTLTPDPSPKVERGVASSSIFYLLHQIFTANFLNPKSEAQNPKINLELFFYAEKH
jgi:hypothetical protein